MKDDNQSSDMKITSLRPLDHEREISFHGDDPEILASNMRLMIACQVIDLALDSAPTQVEGEDIHVTLARVIEEHGGKANVAAGITATPVGEPFDAISICVDGVEAHRLTNIATVPNTGAVTLASDLRWVGVKTEPDGLEARFYAMTPEQRRAASPHVVVPDDLYYVHPEIKGLDPFDNTIPEDLRQLIRAECRHNWAYFYHRVLKVADVQLPEGEAQ